MATEPTITRSKYIKLLCNCICVAAMKLIEFLPAIVLSYRLWHALVDELRILWQRHCRRCRGAARRTRCTACLVFLCELVIVVIANQRTLVLVRCYWGPLQFSGFWSSLELILTVKRGTQSRLLEPALKAWELLANRRGKDPSYTGLVCYLESQ